MRGLSWLLLVLIALSVRPALAAPVTPLVLSAQVGTPTPDLDDSTLRGMTFVGQTCWVVGDRGVVWRSADAGQTWQFVALPEETRSFSFHSVCFLTDRVGWIAGGTVQPVGGVLQGIVLSTKDGGSTWTVIPGQGLPYLRHVQFFDLTAGVAVGEKSNSCPEGVLRTDDGGLTWQPVSFADSGASHGGSWNAAALTSSGRGVLAGDQNRQGVFDQGSIRTGGSGAPGLQSWRGASLDAQGIAWMAGDGATLVRSRNSGVSWESLREQLPSQLEDFCNFSCVTHHGSSVWVAGTPGTVIWHSPDSGMHWVPQRIGNGAPLTAMRFQNERLGVVIGHLGRICVTQDGGQHWQNVRGGERRLACLAIPSRPQRTPLPLLTRWSKEEGYRSAVMIATRRDLGEDAHASEQLPVRLDHSVQTAGGASGWSDWRLPVSLPFLEGDRNRLLEQWNQLTDRRLGDVLLTSLVGQIRTWRPSVLLIDEPTSGDATTELLERAIRRGIELAADPTFALNQTEIAGLAPWQVQKLVMQREPGQTGTVRLHPLEMLPYTQTSLDHAVAPARGQLTISSASSAGNEFLVQCVNQAALSDRTLFVDLGLSPGGEARRALPALRSIDLEQLTKQVQHRRNVTAASERIIADPQRAGQLLAQLPEIIGPLSPEQAALQLAELGKQYQRQGEWDLVESVYGELITRYPDQPPAVEAMVWLLKYWSSAELNWQRLREVQATRSIVRSTPPGAGVVQTALDNAMKAAQSKRESGAVSPLVSQLAATFESETRNLQPTIGDVQSVTSADGQAGNPQQMLLTRWQTAAMAIVQSLQQGYPELSQQPEIQFVTAALLRRRGLHRQADEIYGQFQRTMNNDPWSVAARGETFLLRPGAQSPKPVVICKRTATPPQLDGLLSDPCWLNATEIRLGDQQDDTFIGAGSATRQPGSSNEDRAVVLLARDERFLYIAATVPLHRDLPSDAPDLPGRSHDADLAQFDRLRILLDVDRDYATYYQFEIDQRGQTRDSCCERLDYNPQWFVAATRSADAWRVECAVPLNELLPPERITGTTWGVGLTRLMPGIGTQSWTPSGGTIPQPARFGLVRFE